MTTEAREQFAQVAGSIWRELVDGAIRGAIRVANGDEDDVVGAALIAQESHSRITDILIEQRQAGYKAGLEAATRLLDDKAKHSVYAAELQVAIRQLKE